MKKYKAGEIVYFGSKRCKILRTENVLKDYLIEHCKNKHQAFVFENQIKTMKEIKAEEQARHDALRNRTPEERARDVAHMLRSELPVIICKD